MRLSLCQGTGFFCFLRAQTFAPTLPYRGRVGAWGAAVGQHFNGLCVNGDTDVV